MSITFTSALSSTPDVTFSVTNSPDLSSHPSGYFAVTARSTTGFTLTYSNDSGTAVAPGSTVDFDWVATVNQ